jgi:hypothetical protein|nr:MAG TPA: hypothetical protein [Crassvirales sp.]
MTLLFTITLLLSIYSIIHTSSFVLYKQQQTTKYKELNIKVDNLNETLETFQKTCVKLKDYFIEDNKLRSKINKSNEEIIKIFVEERNKIASDINILMNNQKEMYDFLTSLKEYKDKHKNKINKD